MSESDQNAACRVLNELKHRFLNPEETNREDLIQQIRQCFGRLPNFIEEDDPFLGDPLNDYSFLKDFESIPQGLGERTSILTAATSVLQGQIRWQSPATLHNITPPSMIDSVAISTIANLYNPNAIWDYVSAGVHQLEQQVVRQVSSLVGWTEGDGCFTFGGKACLLYAIRIGINRCLPKASSEGLSNKPSPLVITSAYNHYIIENVCSTLGLGAIACLRVPTSEIESINLGEFKRTLEDAFSKNRPVACIILSGGNTLHVTVDRLRDVVEIVDELREKYSIEYRPFIYFDTVVGWPWLFFKTYDFNDNPLQFSESTLSKLRSGVDLISAAFLADAIGVDFHKIGFCPYGTSLFLMKAAGELHSINRDAVAKQPRQQFGYNFVQQYTLEHSRSAAPILSAWVALQNTGVIGFQAYLGRLISVGEVFRSILPQFDFELLNPFSIGFASVYCPIQKGGEYSYRCLLEKPAEYIEKYNQYVYKLFQYIEGKHDDSSPRVVVRYLQKYRQASCGSWPAAITIYPMSPYSSIQKATELSYKIGNAKLSFDHALNDEVCVEQLPNAMHK